MGEREHVPVQHSCRSSLRLLLLLWEQGQGQLCGRMNLHYKEPRQRRSHNAQGPGVPCTAGGPHLVSCQGHLRDVVRRWKAFLNRNINMKRAEAAMAMARSYCWWVLLTNGSETFTANGAQCTLIDQHAITVSVFVLAALVNAYSTCRKMRSNNQALLT